MGTNLLVGNSGYVYLITPLGNPVTPMEQIFNESQIRTRNPVEEHIVFGSVDFLYYHLE